MKRAPDFFYSIGASTLNSLRRTRAIFGRELQSYFLSPLAYIVLLLFLIANGVTFLFYLRANAGNLELILNSQFGSLTFWFLTLLIPPLLTMRCFAEEKRTGTYELLVTTGASEFTLIAGKFLGACCFYLFLWGMVLPPYLLLEQVTDLDWGMIGTVYGGLALLGMLLCAIGVFASSLSANQLIAACAALVINLMVFFLHYFRFLFEPGDEALRFLQYLSPLGHFGEDFTRGVFDFRYVTLYGSVSLFFLFLAAKTLQKRRWW